MEEAAAADDDNYKLESLQLAQVWHFGRSPFFSLVPCSFHLSILRAPVLIIQTTKKRA